MGDVPGGRITEREQAILARVAAGRSNRQIGQDLSLSESTVKNYMSGVFRKLGTRDRTAAVILALQTGLLYLDKIRVR